MLSRSSTLDGMVLLLLCLQLEPPTLRHLNHSETHRYTNDFWHASARTRKLDRQVQQAQPDREITETMLQNQGKAS